MAVASLTVAPTDSALHGHQLAGSLQSTALADKCERKVDSNESTFVLLIPTKPSRNFFPNLFIMEQKS
ncbi:hypothetical protein [Lactobacillus sp. 3B(2020)]|uniref:hypothetical protein n=1 Tax=Lactobacillus sp. 3B(2020) TaxID=2695882 RepID=UPI001C608C14|nr:hypothetical protein [Lactobacillus sp. 3B(2020)]